MMNFTLSNQVKNTCTDIFVTYSFTDAVASSSITASL